MRNQLIILIILMLPLSKSYAENISDLRLPINLLATCTVENDGTIGFTKAESPIEKILAETAYERSLMSCVQFIAGVAAASEQSGKNYCLPSASLIDLRSAVVLSLKQKYKSSEHSVPIIIEALTKNWPCNS